MSEDTNRSLLGLFLLGLVIGFGSIVSPVLPQFAEQDWGFLCRDRIVLLSLLVYLDLSAALFGLS